MAVTVEGVLSKPIIDYKLQISPVLSKAGCNKGACHASQHGKGGFVLSVVGFDPDKDYTSIVRDRVQRRVDLLMPERSLVLLKPTMQTPHGGGRRLEKGSVAYDMLRGLALAAAPGPQGRRTGGDEAGRDSAAPRRPDRHAAAVAGRSHVQRRQRPRRDAVGQVRFHGRRRAAVVTRHGLVTVTAKAKRPIMVRFEGQAEIAMFVDAVRRQRSNWRVGQNNNFVDELAAAKFRELGIEPSPLCDDATFVRRAFLDAIGTLPTVEEAKAFLESTDADKRKKLDRPAAGPDRRPGPGHLQRPVCGLLDAEMVRPDPQHQQRPGRAGDVGAAQLDPRIVPRRTSRSIGSSASWSRPRARSTCNGPANFFRINRSRHRSDRSRLRSCFSASGWSAPSAIIIRSRSTARTTTTGSPRSSPASARRPAKSSDCSAASRWCVVADVGRGAAIRGPARGWSPRRSTAKRSTIRSTAALPLAEWLTSPENEYFVASGGQSLRGLSAGPRAGRAGRRSCGRTNPPTNPALMDALGRRASSTAAST